MLRRAESLEPRYLLAADVPQVQSIVINGGEAQRSTVETIRVNFDRAVSIDDSETNPFRLTKRDTREPVELTTIEPVDFSEPTE